jgi:hypothetical protein
VSTLNLLLKCGQVTWIPAAGSHHATGAAGGNERHAAEPGEPGTLAKRPAVHHGIPPCAAFALPQGVLPIRPPPTVTHRIADSPLALLSERTLLEAARITAANHDMLTVGD